MRMLIALFVSASLSLVALPGTHGGAQAAVVQGRAKAKKKRPRAGKAKATKKPDKAKKNDRGFEL